MRYDPSCPIELKGIARGSEMRLFLLGAEVWRGVTFLGVLPVQWFADRIKERLEYIEGTEQLKFEFAADPARPLGSPVDTSLPLPRKPPVFMPITREMKAKRREARKRKRKAS